MENTLTDLYNVSLSSKLLEKPKRLSGSAGYISAKIQHTVTLL